MLTDLKNLSQTLDLLDNGTLYQYNIDTGKPEILGWSGYLFAYTSSTLGCRTNLSVFFDHATSIFSKLSYKPSNIKSALNLEAISNEDLQKIKEIAERSLIACRKQPSPLLQNCFETVQEITSTELLKRECLQLASKSEIVLADQEAETRFLDCLLLEGNEVEAIKGDLKQQFEKDIDRIKWHFRQSVGIVTVSDSPSVLKIIEKILENQKPKLDKTAKDSKRDLIKIFCNQATATILTGRFDLTESAPESYKAVSRQLVGSRFHELVSENPDERMHWGFRILEANCEIATDLSEMTYSNLYGIMFEESHLENPVATIKAKVTINLLHDRLTLFPAYEPSIREHATATDLEKLKFIFS